MVSYDFCKASHEAGVLYSELRFSPAFFSHSKIAPDNVTLTCDQVLDAILDGIHRGERDFGIKVNLIIVSMIHMPGMFKVVLNFYCIRSWAVYIIHNSNGILIAL